MFVMLIRTVPLDEISLIYIIIGYCVQIELSNFNSLSFMLNPNQ